MEEHLTSSEASAAAVHKTKNAQAAVELAREVQMEEMIQKTAEQTEDAVLRALTAVFGKGDEGATGEMNILIRRIPFICNDIAQIHKDNSATTKAIEKINSNIARGVWIVLAAVIVALLKIVLIH